jgi:hypothetical protein
MHKSLPIAILMAVAPVSSIAQGADVMDGHWTATRARDKGGEDRTSQVAISGTTGTWRDVARGKQAARNGCLEKDFPVTVQSTAPGEFTLQVKASSVLEGCGDHTYILKQVDGNTFEGTRGNGEPVKLVRH